MTTQELRAVPAIDFHSHIGLWNVEERFQPAAQREMPGDLEFLLRNNAHSNIALSLVSHLKTMMPRGGGDLQGNEICAQDVSPLGGVMMYAVLNPLKPETYEQTERLLLSPKCAGIKIHPEEHCYPIKKHGGAIYEFAAKHNAMIITHSGEENSMPEDICVFANRFPEVVTIVSHMGCGWDGSMMHQARAIERCVHGNLYTDTSSAKSMMSRLLENYVAEIGWDRILFGTDSACYFSPSQRARVDFADIPDEAKLDILYRNGLRAFPALAPAYERACALMRGK